MLPVGFKDRPDYEHLRSLFRKAASRHQAPSQLEELARESCRLVLGMSASS